MFSRHYSLRKSRKILHWAFSWWKKKGKKLTEEERLRYEGTLRQLEDAVFDRDRERADQKAREAETLAHTHFKRTWWEFGLEICFAIAFALVVAAVVRQSWFELYEIPTGSMRPSFREQDRLTVSKTSFGINVPLQTKHFYFDPDLVRRSGVLIFSGDGLPLPDTDTTYFGIIPYKKRYIKRLIGKPGDTLYFYGGKIYGIDREGKPLDDLLQDPWMQKLEHLPFLSFEGEMGTSNQNEVVFQQMHQPLGRIRFTRMGAAQGEVFDGESWVKDNPFHTNEEKKIHSYGDWMGMGHFAMARLMTKEQLKKYAGINPSDMEEGILYLQLRHTPNLTYPPPRLYKDGGRFGLQLSTFETVIPLQQRHLDAIMDNLYTSRFVVKDGRSRRYSADHENFRAGNPLFAKVPNGTYEFYHGKAMKVSWKGKTTELPKDHPLYKRDPERVQELYNLGIEMLTDYEPNTFFQVYWPHRYAYFREGDLYLMGAPILKKDDPVLQSFIKREMEKETRASKDKPYLAFRDPGPPLKEGVLDRELIQTYGIKIPEKKYLVLGDNHAMSADSRVFGLVPEENLEGTPSFILWPPGERWGYPPQTPYPFMTLPRAIVWTIAGIIFGVWYLIHRKRMNTRLFPKS